MAYTHSFRFHKDLFHLLKFIELAVTEARWAIGLLAVDARVAVLVCRDDVLASEALASCCLGVLHDHRLLVAGASVLLHALVFGAESQALLLSSVQNQLVGEVLHHIKPLGVQLFDVEVLDALVIGELASWVLLVADLAHDHHFSAVSLYVVIELCSRHVLVLITIANVATKFGAVELSMCLKLSKSLPDDLVLSIQRWALVRELTEVDTVLEDLVYRLEEITSALAVRAANIKVRSRSHLPSHR